MTPQHPKARFARCTLAAASLAALTLAAGPVGTALASSHREAPFITTSPKVDGSDIYLFRSYETGRSEYVTMIMNYQPLQDAYGGPNYFSLDPNALYEFHIDNNGDAREDITFQFRFSNRLANGGSGIALPIGGSSVAIPLLQAGQVSMVRDPALNLAEQYTVTIVRGDRRSGSAAPLRNRANSSTTFDKPVDNIGAKTIPDYTAYAQRHVHEVDIPGCAMPGRVFVGQRQEGFAVNLGVIFDLVNAPVGVITDPSLIGALPNTIGSKNVSTMALEVHRSCLTQGSESVIGGWSTASLRQSRLLNPSPPSGHQTSETVGGAWVQVSRLGMPLVNEVVIGLKDKDRFNASRPQADAQFASYVTNPTLPALLEIALGLPGIAPTNLPRNDLVVTFLTGIPGVNRPAGVVPSEMLRLNTAIAPVPFAQQNRLGIVGEILRVGGPANLGMAVDLAGYPNGRRPKDDTVDISLVAVMGGLCLLNGNSDALGFGPDCNPGRVPLGSTAYNLHDAVDQAREPFLDRFPYLFTPVPGAGTNR
jgi:hypothetical protein